MNFENAQRSGDRAEKIVSPDQRIAILPVVFALERVHRFIGCHPPTVLESEELLDFVANA